MVYKKYIKRGNKLYGPYIYESKREGDKVITNYIGKGDTRKDKLKLNYVLLLIPILVLVTLLLFMKVPFYTTRVVLEPSPIYKINETITGDVRIRMKHGEFIPADSVISFKLNNQTREITLSELLSTNQTEGNFYAEYTELSGSGAGYGWVGEKKWYPTIYFKLLVYQAGIKHGEEKKEENVTGNISEGGKETKKKAANVTGTNETPQAAQEIIPTNETTEETPPETTPTEETPTETPSETPEETTPTEEIPTEEGAGGELTGSIVMESRVIDGEVSALKEFESELGTGETATIVQGSVWTEEKNLSYDVLDLKIQQKKVTVSTGYFESERGFGKEFLTDETETMKADLEKIGFKAEKGLLEVAIFYDGVKIAESAKRIIISKVEENVTALENITIENITVTNESLITLIKNIPDINIAKNSNYTLNLKEYFSSNLTLDYSAIYPENITINIEGDKAEIIPDLEFTGTRTSKIFASTENFSLESNLFNILVSEQNISLKTSMQARLGKPVRWEKKIKLEIPANFTIQIPAEAKNISVKKIENGEEIEIEQNLEIKPGVTGQVSLEISLKREPFLSRFLKLIWRTITGRAVEIVVPEELTENITELTISDNATEYKVEYYTSAPYAREIRLEKGKKEVTIESAIPYTDVLAYTFIEESPRDKVKVSGTENYELVDNNKDNLTDEVDWIANTGQKVNIEVERKEDKAVERTANSEIYSEDNKTFTALIYPQQINVLQNGNYVPITEILDVYSDYNNVIYISDGENNLELKPYFVVGGEKSYLENITSYDITAHTHIYDNKALYKYALGIFNFSQLQAEKVGFEIKGEKVSISGNKVISDKIIVDFSDIAEKYKLEMNNEYVEISLSNLTNIYDLYLDPTITLLTSGNIAEDGYIEAYQALACPGAQASSCSNYLTQAECEGNHTGPNGVGPSGYLTCSWLIGPGICDYVSACGAKKDTTSSTFLVVGADYFDARAYISWNTSSIPDSANITQINFTFQYNYAGGGEHTVMMNVTNMAGYKASNFSTGIPNNATNNQQLWLNISSSRGVLANGSYSFVGEADPQPTTAQANLTLLNGANTTMQNQLSQDYFMFGLIGNTTPESHNGFSIDSSTGTNPPYLTVLYSAPDTAAPSVYLWYPANNTQTSTAEQYFYANFSDESGLQNATLYIWNSSNASVYNVSNTSIRGTYNFSNFSYTFTYSDTYKWNYYVCDNITSANCGWNNTNYTLTYTTTSVSACTNITVSGNYALTADITNTAISYCINITAGNVSFDCQGHTIDSNGVADYGIWISRSTLTNTNITIKNCRLNDWDTSSIYNYRANNNNFTNINITNSKDYGFNIRDSRYANFFSINVNNSVLAGIYMQNSSSNNLTNINLTSNVNTGLDLYSTSNNNKIINLISSRNLGYGGVYIRTNSDNNEIIGMNSTLDRYGVYLSTATSTGNLITNSTITRATTYGVYVAASTLNNIYNNKLNNSNNYYVQNNNKNFWNTTKTTATNIVGGGGVGGNYWTNPTATGFSDTCADANADGICDSSYTLRTNNIDYLPLSKTTHPNPEIVIYSPLNNTFINNNITIKTRVNATVGVANVSFYYKNSSVAWTLLCNDTTSPYECLWNTDLFSNTTEGYDINATVYDNNNNKNYSVRHYTIDRTRPYIGEINVEYPTEQESVRNNQTVVLRVNVTDSPYIAAGMNISKVDLTGLNGTGNTSMSLESGSKAAGIWSYWNLTVNISAATGSKYPRIYAYDNATPINNLRDSEVFYVEIDNNVPTSSSLGSSGQVCNSTTAGFYVNVFDNYNLSSYIFSSNLSGSWGNDSSVDISGVAYSISLSKTVTIGNYSYKFYIFDDAGNMNYTSEGIIEGIVCFPFAVYLSQPSDNQILNYSSVNLTWWYENGVAENCSLYLDTELNTTVTNPANYTILNFTRNFADNTDSNYTWYVECTENVTGDIYQSNTRTFRVDTSIPQITIISPLNQTYASTRVSFNVSLNEAGAWCGYSLDRASNRSLTKLNNTYFYYTKTGLTQGSHNIIFSCNDTAGNLNASSGYVYFAVDTVAPNVTINSPLNQSYNDTNLIYINVTVTDATSSINSTIVYNGTDNVTYTIPILINYSYGSHTVIAFANDSVGNSNSSSVTFNVNYSGAPGAPDTTAPNITPTSPAEGYSTTSTSINFQFNVSDASGIANCSLYIDDAVSATSSSISTTATNTITGTSTVGSHTWKIGCIDSSINENKANSSSRTFTITETETGDGGRGRCSSECIDGTEEASCGNASTVKARTCGNYDADNCFEWSAWSYETCSSNKECRTGTCVLTGSCNESWTCTAWSDCEVGRISRNCTDINNCGTEIFKPKEIDTCEIRGLKIYATPEERNLKLPLTGKLTFSITAIEESVVTEPVTVMVAWYEDNTKIKQEAGLGKVDSSLTVDLASGINEVKAVVADKYNTGSVTWSIEYVNVSECKENWMCEWSLCDENGYKYPENCTDLNNCGTNMDYPGYEKCTCIPRWTECTGWSSCNAVYNFQDVILGKTKIRGKQFRYCNDTRNCYNETRFEQSCNMTIPVTAKKAAWCEEEYVEVSEKTTGKLVSRVREIQVQNMSRINIGLIVSNFTGYCDYCYNHVKDYDETGVDCGGSCPECVEIKEKFDWLRVVIIASWSLLALLLIIFIILSAREKRKKKSYKKIS